MKDIKLACNWSRPLGQLLDEKAVRLDYVKALVSERFYEDIDKMLSYAPVLIHGLGYRGHTGMRNLHEVDFDKVNTLIGKCGSPHYGLHFGMENKNVGTMTDQEIYKYMSEQTQVFKERLKVPLLLENTPDSITDRTVYDIYAKFQHEYLTRFLIDNDVFFLLDVSHAKVAALFNGWDINEYIERFPLDKVRELHVNGSGYDENGNVMDAHRAMQSEDYELLEWVLERTEPQIITLEYSGIAGENDETIRENIVIQLDKLNAVIKNS